MCRHQAPQDCTEAVVPDERNDSTKWQDAIALEMKQLHECDTFTDKGMCSANKIPTGFKKISAHLAFAVKHGRGQEARLVSH